jgi:hypothetical protein
MTVKYRTKIRYCQAQVLTARMLPCPGRDFPPRAPTRQPAPVPAALKKDKVRKTLG